MAVSRDKGLVPTYVRALMVDPTTGLSSDPMSDFGVTSVASTSVGEVGLRSGIVRSPKAPPVSLQPIVQRIGSEYAYHVIMAQLSTGKHTLLTFAAPITDALQRMRPAGSLLYARVRLRRVCQDQFLGASEARCVLTRMSGRLWGDQMDRVRSVHLFGKDVMASPMLDDLLYAADADRDQRPSPFIEGRAAFGGRMGEPRLDSPRYTIEVGSCRLVWDDGDNPALGVNLDRFGNCSFRLTRPEDVTSLARLFQYIDSIGALSLDTRGDPLRRSAASLRAIEREAHDEQ